MKYGQQVARAPAISHSERIEESQAFHQDTSARSAGHNFSRTR